MDEPVLKKQKVTDWENHTLNVSVLVKADTGMFLGDVAKEPVSAIKGIGKVSAKVLHNLGVETVEDLGNYKYFQLARAITTLAVTEEKDKRPETSMMNIDHALMKDSETKSLREIVDGPVSAFDGMTDAAGDVLAELGVKTVGDLATFKYCCWAESIVKLSKYEERKTAIERRKEHELNKLA
jgi:predicted flap endonuclease-1-like 5' DNA nuclease|uniref:Uncharacterized protein n=1 Tax=Attheya septentrionalis TaxID=420275 RepID=A0A7S2UQK3_9STRA|mmetsp:Transcript_5511/g.9715  ORF Transcript_5511/g.9715 Transcript_5511/m.9715 type:complete len:182 (+) Transcript_5511:158-703(+)|eukprot:CAMPEP_0198281238 /NCGR_PEP_ID=MMETSP1449-20131203/1216_1 /TAXON_ID=420275 /ORGANISM="Attheya septentrionalis, Strain CCMP2084" /LENGTH=181 /DNA_ID=CAMNT_0043976939 /DNA_START=119 /DNA_END=664 /DNA_ORIENTATION=-